MVKALSPEEEDRRRLCRERRRSSPSASNTSIALRGCSSHREYVTTNRCTVIAGLSSDSSRQDGASQPWSPVAIHLDLFAAIKPWRLRTLVSSGPFCVCLIVSGEHFDLEDRKGARIRAAGFALLLQAANPCSSRWTIMVFSGICSILAASLSLALRALGSRT